MCTLHYNLAAVNMNTLFMLIQFSKYNSIFISVNLMSDFKTAQFQFAPKNHSGEKIFVSLLIILL